MLGDESVHAFQYDPGSGTGGAWALMLPLWFIKGMAERPHYRRTNDPHTAMWLRDAVLSERLPTIKELRDPKYFPYRYGQALWAYLGSRFGDNVVGNAMYLGDGRRRRSPAIEDGRRASTRRRCRRNGTRRCARCTRRRRAARRRPTRSACR